MGFRSEILTKPYWYLVPDLSPPLSTGNAILEDTPKTNVGSTLPTSCLEDLRGWFFFLQYKWESFKIVKQTAQMSKSLPYAPCMVYLPTFTIKINHMQVHVPFIECLGKHAKNCSTPFLQCYLFIELGSCRTCIFGCHKGFALGITSTYLNIKMQWHPDGRPVLQLLLVSWNLVEMMTPLFVLSFYSSHPLRDNIICFTTA